MGRKAREAMLEDERENYDEYVAMGKVGESECNEYVCCRCKKGPKKAWLGAIKFGEHMLCATCYGELEAEWGCQS